VPTRYPPVGLFDAVAHPADLEAVFAIEALGNPRLREAAGALSLVPREHRISGPGTSPIMAAFTHLNPEGSRFSDGTYGVYYAADVLETAVAEVSHHRARFLARTQEPPIDIDLRCYRVPVRARLVDLRGRNAQADLLAPDHYAGVAGVRRGPARRRRAGHRACQRAAPRRALRGAVHAEGDGAAGPAIRTCHLALGRVAHRGVVPEIGRPRAVTA
jgi:hypothetical protein